MSNENRLESKKRTKIAFNQFFFLRKSNGYKMSAKSKSCSGNIDWIIHDWLIATGHIQRKWFAGFGFFRIGSPGPRAFFLGFSKQEHLLGFLTYWPYPPSGSRASGTWDREACSWTLLHPKARRCSPVQHKEPDTGERVSRRRIVSMCLISANPHYQWTRVPNQASLGRNERSNERPHGAFLQHNKYTRIWMNDE